MTSNLVICGRHSESMPTISLPVSDRKISQSFSLPIKVTLTFGGSRRQLLLEVGPN